MKQPIKIAAAAFLAAAILCAPVSALSAQSACVMDAQTGAILYAKNETEPGLIASTTKIMTGLLICEDCDLDAQITVPPEAAGIEGSSMYLEAGVRMRVEDLLCGLLLRSGNDCAWALAMAHSGSVDAFVRAMNARARALGLRSTHFANPHGLDDAQNYSTAADLARLACAAMDNPDFARIAGTKSRRIGAQTVTNHNRLLWRYPGADGVKTGFTKAAGRILVSSAVRQGRRLVCVTIRDPDDWNDHCRLLDEGFSRFSDVLLCARGQVMGLGPSGAPMVCDRDVRALLLPDECVQGVRVTLTHGGGQAAFLCAGRVLATCPLEERRTGENNGGTDPENHSGPTGRIPQESGRADPRGPGASERQYGGSGRAGRSR